MPEMFGLSGGNQDTITIDMPPVLPNSTPDVIIKKVCNGFIIKVGCKTFVEKDWSKVADGLVLYWKNPSEAEKKFCKEK